jgi:hypothetical protein
VTNAGTYLETLPRLSLQDTTIRASTEGSSRRDSEWGRATPAFTWKGTKRTSTSRSDTSPNQLRHWNIDVARSLPRCVALLPTVSSTWS